MKEILWNNSRGKETNQEVWAKIWRRSNGKVTCNGDNMNEINIPRV